MIAPSKYNKTVVLSNFMCAYAQFTKLGLALALLNSLNSTENHGHSKTPLSLHQYYLTEL